MRLEERFFLHKKIRRAVVFCGSIKGMDKRTELLESCMLCPRACGVDRLAGETGYCGAGPGARIARAALHHWEEPCISGARGSGTVFFSHCSMGCAYCQNAAISSGQAGREVGAERLSDIFLELQAQGAHNINLVTADHYLPQTLDALDMAKQNGLAVPVVYNCSGWQTEETVRMLDGYADVWLVDFKYWGDGPAARYSNAAGYANVAKRALDLMLRQAGPPVTGPQGILQRGVVVRHLVLPGQLEDSKAIISYLYQAYGKDILLSIMSQYTPVPGVERFPGLSRAVTRAEYGELIDFAVSIGVEDAYIQEGGAAAESFIPPFDYTGV